MKNWKTTSTGLLAALGQFLPLFGVPPEIGTAITSISLALLGMFAKDLNVTGP